MPDDRIAPEWMVKVPRLLKGEAYASGATLNCVNSTGCHFGWPELPCFRFSLLLINNQTHSRAAKHSDHLGPSARSMASRIRNWHRFVAGLQLREWIQNGLSA